MSKTSVLNVSTKGTLGGISTKFRKALWHLLSVTSLVVGAVLSSLFLVTGPSGAVTAPNGIGTIGTVVGSGVKGMSSNPQLLTGESFNFAGGGDVISIQGGLIITDSGNNQVVMADTTTGDYFGIAMTAGSVYTIAGNGTPGYSGNGGAGPQAELNNPGATALSASGVLYIADTGNNVIRALSPSGIISTVIGSGAQGLSPNGTPALATELYAPGIVRIGANGAFYIESDLGGGSSDCAVWVVPSVSGQYFGMSMNAGDSYVVAGGNSCANDSGSAASGIGGKATSANISGAGGFAVTPGGSIIMSDVAYCYGRGYCIASSTSFSMLVKVSFGSDLLESVAGEINNGNSFGGDGALATGANLNGPYGIAVDRYGDIAFDDSQNCVIRFIPAISATFFGQPMLAGNIYTIAGNRTCGYSGDGGMATAAGISSAVASLSFDSAGDLYLLDSGNQVVREIIARYPTQVTNNTSGYDLVGSDGGVFVFPTGQSQGFYGSLPGLHVQVNNIVGMVTTSTETGYFLVGSDGGVFAFGNAPFLGSLPGINVRVNDIVGIVPTGNDQGYFLVGRDGGVFAFGNAPFLGSCPQANSGCQGVDNIIGIAATPSGNGYWVVGSDGSVYGFGAAQQLGSATNTTAPVTAIAGTANGGGYWIVASDGSVYPFGNAGNFGDLPALSVTPSLPVIGIVHTSDEMGYWMFGADGGVFAFGNAPEVGSLPGLNVHVSDIVGAVPTLG